MCRATKLIRAERSGIDDVVPLHGGRVKPLKTSWPFLRKTEQISRRITIIENKRLK